MIGLTCSVLLREGKPSIELKKNKRGGNRGHNVKGQIDVALMCNRPGLQCKGNAD